jgi:hypothetical protein
MLRFRLATLLCFFLILFVALISRAIQLQILSGKTLKTMAERQHIQPVLLQPERGIIFDRNGRKLAASVQVDSVCADPAPVADPEEPRVSSPRFSGWTGDPPEETRCPETVRLDRPADFRRQGGGPGEAEDRGHLHGEGGKADLPQRRVGGGRDRLCRHRCRRARRSGDALQ